VTSQPNALKVYLMAHYRIDTSASSLLRLCEGLTRSLAQVTDLEQDMHAGKLAMTKAGHALYHEYTYESIDFALKQKLSDLLLWVGYLPLVLWTLVHDSLFVMAALTWAILTRLVYHKEYPQCKAISDSLTQPKAILVDHNDYPCLSRQKGCHVLGLYGSTPIPTGLWSGILCLQEHHIFLCVPCLKPIFLGGTDAYGVCRLAGLVDLMNRN